MANRYSKANMQKDYVSPNKEETKSDLSKYEKKRKRLDASARVMAIIVSLAMIVTAFLSAGLFFFK